MKTRVLTLSLELNRELRGGQFCSGRWQVRADQWSKPGIASAICASNCAPSSATI
jgi:hypothetical protein